MSPLAVPFDWDRAGGTPIRWPDALALHDETLRDGLQSPSVPDPPLPVKADLVRALSRAGIASTCLALPGAGPRAAADARALLRVIDDEALAIRLALAARTIDVDIDAVAACAEDTAVAVEITCFVGASPIRQWVEGWTPAWLEQQARRAVRRAARAGLSVSFVLEDTTRTRPEMLRRLFDAALDEGAGRLVLCDTVGHATPKGVTHLVRWVRGHLLGHGARPGLDWHAHDDRGLALANALAAAQAGCDRIHGCLLGVGERVGNADLRDLARELDRQGAGRWSDDALGHAEGLLRGALAARGRRQAG